VDDAVGAGDEEAAVGVGHADAVGGDGVGDAVAAGDGVEDVDGALAGADEQVGAVGGHGVDGAAAGGEELEVHAADRGLVDEGAPASGEDGAAEENGGLLGVAEVVGVDERAVFGFVPLDLTRVVGDVERVAPPGHGEGVADDGEGALEEPGVEIDAVDGAVGAGGEDIASLEDEALDVAAAGDGAVDDAGVGVEVPDLSEVAGEVEVVGAGGGSGCGREGDGGEGGPCERAVHVVLLAECACGGRCRSGPRGLLHT